MPEFLVQLRDPNLLGGPLFATLLARFGFALVTALCAVLAAGALLLVAWRARVRGAPDLFAALAGVLAALCLAGRLGVSLDPVGWICAAGFALALERKHGGITSALAILALWSFTQGGAPLGSLLALVALIGALIDARRFDSAVREKAALAGAALIIGAVQLHGVPWHTYGPHALYLDALALGAQRDRLWNGGFSLQAASFCALIVSAAWYGVRRRDRSADAIGFFAVALLAIIDARNLPYLGIIGAPIVADAAAGYYVDLRTYPRGSVRQYAAAFTAAAFAFIAVNTATQSKITALPQAAEEPVSLLSALANDRRPHTVLCEQPRWCDDAGGRFADVQALMDDRAGITGTEQRRTQHDAVATRGDWRSELGRAGVDAVIAKEDANIVALLDSTGWRERANDGTRVLLLRGGAQ